MKRILKNLTAWIMVVCMIVGFMPVFASAADEEAEPIQVLMWTRTKKDLLVETTYTFSELFAYSALSESDFEQMVDLEKAIAARGEPGDLDIYGLLAAAFESVGMDLALLSPEELLDKSSDVMDDVVVYIFAGLKALGINVDPFYEKLASNLIVYWFVHTYVGTVPATDDLTALEKEIAAKGLDNANMRSLMNAALESVGLDHKTMTAADILNLPADEMDDVVTMIFAGLMALGVDIDPVYKKLSSNKILGWFVYAYIEPKTPSASDLLELQNRIAAKGLDDQKMRYLLRSALESIGRCFQTMTTADILELPNDDIDDLLTYLFAGLKALGINIDPTFEKIAYTQKTLKWFIGAYVAPYIPVRLTCDTAQTVIIDHEKETVKVCTVADTQEVTFTLSVSDPDSACQPISYTAVIRTSPKKISDWIRELWQAVRAFRWNEVFTIIKDFIYSLILGK